MPIFPFSHLVTHRAKNNGQPAKPAAQTKAANLVSYAPLGGPVWTHRNYAALAREGYQKNAIAYRCVRMIAEAVASVPLHAKNHLGQPHSFAHLLARANRDESWAELIENFVGHLEIAGNAYVELCWLGGTGDIGAAEICVLRPDQVSVITGPDGWAKGWIHQAGHQKRQIMRQADKSPLLHLKLFNPLDDIYGQSPIEAAATAIDIHNAGGAWNKALIDNAARPSGALIYRGEAGDRLSDAAFERLKAELNYAHAGAQNAGRPLLLEGGLEWTPMSLSPADMDFIEARRAASRDIALAFGVPPMLLGIPGDNTYANYKEANLAFWRSTILPLAKKIAKAFEGFLGAWTDEPLTLECDLEEVPALAAERDLLWARISAADFLSADEKRHLAGLSPALANMAANKGTNKLGEGAPL